MSETASELERRLEEAESRAAVLEKILSRIVSRTLGYGGVWTVTERDLARWHPAFIVEPHHGGYKLSFAPFNMVPAGKSQ